LGPFPGAPSTNSAALAVSPDGSIIVGRADGPDLSDRAFVWTAADGMRDLKTVLTEDYGLDLTGWVLSEATGISDVADGEYTIVGTGTNPLGQEEGFVAFLSVPACSDGSDNDSDTAIDHPADPGCSSPIDWSETFDCSDGLDNDEDGDTDHPADDGCASASDQTERPDCSDGVDNDADTFVDHPQDPGCAAAAAPIENPACQNGLDDDLDLRVDHPLDTQCTAPFDRSETPDCSDGLDNDGDAAIDYPADPECESAADLGEAAQCADGFDNDGDGRIDYPDQYPGCVSASDPIERAQCGDGIDNDGDSAIDYPADTGCSAAAAPSESPVALTAGTLVAVDRASRAVFRVDVATGAQTPISQAARLQAPQGIAQRGGELVVADPAGLVTVAGSGVQRLASPPLAANESLQVVFDAALHAYVLETGGISKVVWNPSGVGAKTTWLAVPTPEPVPQLSLFHGDALAIEQSGAFLTSGISLFGDGVYRLTPPAPTVAILRQGVENLKWRDLAVEANGTILAVGNKGAETGVYRVNPSTGASTALNESYAWQTPTGVAVAENGEIYVADAGACANGSCSGGSIVRVNPGSGAATPLASGGLIAGELDVVVLPEPAEWSTWLAGLGALAALRRRSTR
jgi:MYXO-CTERM domain-containing protein